MTQQKIGEHRASIPDTSGTTVTHPTSLDSKVASRLEPVIRVQQTGVLPQHPRDPQNPSQPKIITPALPEMKEVPSPVIEHIDDPIERMKRKDLTCTICGIARQFAIETSDGVICFTCVGKAAIAILRNEKKDPQENAQNTSPQPIAQQDQTYIPITQNALQQGTATRPIRVVKRVA